MEENQKSLFIKKSIIMDNNDPLIENTESIWDQSGEKVSIVVSEKLLRDINTFIGKYSGTETRHRAGRLLIKYIMKKARL